MHFERGTQGRPSKSRSIIHVAYFVLWEEGRGIRGGEGGQILPTSDDGQPAVEVGQV